MSHESMNNAVMGGIQSIHCYIAMVTHIILYMQMLKEL